MATTPLVLGLNSSHPDSAAFLAGPNGVIAAICEERINRQKHCSIFPREAIQEVLRMAGASMSDVTDIAVARDSKANLSAKLGFIARNPRVGLNLAKIRLGVQKGTGGTSQSFAQQCGVPESAIKARMHNVEHHLAHLASSYYWSNFDHATGVSIDGSGDWCSVMIAKCQGNTIEVLRRTHPPHSLGIFYTALCGLLGFNKYGEEYKVMGLAAYGHDKYRKEIHDLVSWSWDRGVRLDLDYFTSYTTVHSAEERTFGVGADGEFKYPKMWSEKLEQLLGPARNRSTPLSQREQDLALSMQLRFEEIYMEIIKDSIVHCGSRNLVMAGGCALNGVANGKVMMQGLADRVYIHPAAGDDGTAAGAALWVLHNKLGVPRTGEVGHAYWGTEWNDDQIEKAARESGLPFKKFDKPALMNTTIDAFCQGKIVGWFQGREEWGPRALGNRSILANPNWPDMKAILNARIKNREHFRPFAPAILEDRLGEVYEGSHNVPFMNIVYKTRPEWRERLSAVNHQDDTGRVQTVRRDQNQTYYDLIKNFGDRTGVPVLLNTSFNENEPIVHTPQQAIACFARTKMDSLGIGSFWFDKSADLAAKAQVIAAEA